MLSIVSIAGAAVASSGGAGSGGASSGASGQDGAAIVAGGDANSSLKLKEEGNIIKKKGLNKS